MKAATVKEKRLTVSGECNSCGVCVGKCPFGAVAPEAKSLFRIYVGGTWGKKTRMGTALSRYYTEDELFSVLEKTMLWYKENAYEKERLGAAVDRIGREVLEMALESDDLLNRKDEIIAAPMKTRA